MQPNELPPYPWHTVIIDYVTGFLMTAHADIHVYNAMHLLYLWMH